MKNTASEEEILAHCDPSFAMAWRNLEASQPLFGSFIDAACVAKVSSNGKGAILLHKLGMREGFEHFVEEWSENAFSRARWRDRKQLEKACAEAVETGAIITVKTSFRTKGADGRLDPNATVFVRLSIQHVGTMDDAALLYIAVKDISNKYQRERSITREQYASSLRAIFSEVTLMDIDSGVHSPIYLDGAEIADEDEAYADCGLHHLFKTLHPDDKRVFWKHASNANIVRTLYGETPGEAINFDARRMESDGSFHWVSIYLARIDYDNDSRNVLICVRNIDEQKEAQRRERELRGRAQNDGLTGVFNRGTTEELITAALEAAGEENEPLFAIFDVDNFKNVNDTYGHIAGDEVLKCVAQSIRSITRENDVVGRLGGDEFVALFAGNGASAVDSITKRLDRCMDEVAEFSTDRGIEPPVTMSIGLVRCHGGVRSFHQAFEAADKMLYEAKGEGKNGYRLCR